MLALLVAWTTILAVTWLFDELCDAPMYWIAIDWLCLGNGVTPVKKIYFPMPCADRLDVPGAFRMLWWAAFRPRELSA
ncbi:hypothetical protein [Massilia sp. Root335]|uniref:hypothetical protein n=1 Tax=Massilia sp. Root335 TaxID=1736517 RepID=UPI0006FC2004|nr:hypothetical protein [Massilia sp. Root335]